MSLLTRPQRLTLEGLLMRLPNINDVASRNLLLVDLPQNLTQMIQFDGAAGTHVANIVNAVNNDTWARLPNGTVPLLLVIENAIYTVQGSGLAAELQKFHDTIQTGSPLSDSEEEQTAPVAQAPPLASPTISLTNLPGPRRRQLHYALLSAFPTVSDLRRMVSFGLGENLAKIATGDSLDEIVLALVVWAQAQGRLEELLQAAVDDNPGNASLEAFAKAAGLVP